MTSTAAELDRKAVNVIKGLIMDATRQANSGHPGGAMSSADMAYVLFHDFLRFDPHDASWFARDRFVLSAGHESMLLYALLTLRGLLTVDDLTAFRQFESKTPGHPEYGLTPGVECTGGPLGQGFAMAVGMAVAESMLRARLGEDVAGHHTFVLASDGDIEEPVCLGSAALAGKWSLNRLTVLYDSNAIQLAGPTSRSEGTDHKKLFESLGWRVIEIDGHDHTAITGAILAAKAEKTAPTLIIGHTIMAKGAATMEGKSAAHGAPFSEEEIRDTKKKLGLPVDKRFFLPEEVVTHFRSRFTALAETRQAWDTALQEHLGADDDFEGLWRQINRPARQRCLIWPNFPADKPMATRKAWGAALTALIDQLPQLVGGSADLDPSNQTEKFREMTGIYGPDKPLGRNLCFGVREFPMGAIVNGIALHGGLVPFGATFLLFSDYERNALRMAALQGVPSLHIFTHDSFYVGEDGPTHQPIEQTSSLRLIPNLLVMRPADANETCIALELALNQEHRPTCLLLTRQGLPVLDAAHFPNLRENARRGGYILQEARGGKPDLVLLAAGSEVSLALDTVKLLPKKRIRVVSLPCMELFNEQDAAYRASVLGPESTPRFAVEAGRPELWCQYTGSLDRVHGISHFGASAPASKLAEAYGFTPEHLAQKIEAIFQK